MSIATWEFSRDEMPTSVHGLMSLWGGFDAPAGDVDSGLEKRLEIEFTVAHGNGLLAAPLAAWGALMLEALGERVVRETASADGTLHTLLGDHCVVVISRARLVITAAATLLLHRATAPLLRLCATHGCQPEWVSFMRKNTTSPWDAEPADTPTPVGGESPTCANGTTDKAARCAMASEYADLKSAFPRGRAFLIGPVDGDHYFYFVFDNVDRRAGPTRAVENEVQINVVMYAVADAPADASEDGDRGPVALHETRGKGGAVNARQRVTHLGGGEYETLRTFCSSADGVPCATFETNAAGRDHAARVAELLTAHQPERFTLITLFDPESAEFRRFASGSGLDRFAGYAVENRVTTEFAPGYCVRKVIFQREQ